MNREQAVADLTNVMSKFTAYIGKRLPTDVTQKLGDLREKEVNFLAKEVYESMRQNQEAADKLDRPSCQDTGVIQYFLTAGANFPLLGELEEILQEATAGATREGPLRHNAVETFVEKNTGTNTGSKIPWLDWDIVPGDDSVTIDVYMAGGGCTLPGKATVLMPGQGYEGVAEFVFDVITSRGVNACPPLLVGVGIGTSIDSAAFMAKKALMRPVGSHNANPKAAALEDQMVAAIDSIGLGPQGLTGSKSVMGVNIVNSSRHPSVISCALNVGCWSHRRGTITINSDLSYQSSTHKGVAL